MVTIEEKEKRKAFLAALKTGHDMVITMGDAKMTLLKPSTDEWSCVYSIVANALMWAIEQDMADTQQTNDKQKVNPGSK